MDFPFSFLFPSLHRCFCLKLIFSIWSTVEHSKLNGYYNNLMFDFRSHVINSRGLVEFGFGCRLSVALGQCWDHSIWFIIFVLISFFICSSSPLFLSMTIYNPFTRIWSEEQRNGRCRRSNNLYFFFLFFFLFENLYSCVMFCFVKKMKWNNEKKKIIHLETHLDFK